MGSKNRDVTQRPLVIIDTREQIPYSFPHSIIATLKTGDYSLRGYEDRVAIERKTKSDAYNSLGYKRNRFKREIERLAEMDYGAIVIEASLSDFLHAPAYSQLNPQSALGSLLAWSVRYGVHVIFADDREHGNAVTGQLLRKYWHYHRGGGHG